MDQTTKRSESRQRTKTLGIRLTPDEHARATKLAAERGLSVAAYFRLRALGKTGDRSRRQPKPQNRDLAEVLAGLQRIAAEHNKTGSNLNQLARHANRFGIGGLKKADVQASLAAYDEAVAELSAMRSMVMAALGYDDR